MISFLCTFEPHSSKVLIVSCWFILIFFGTISSGFGCPEVARARLRTSPKSSPEANSVINRNINPITGSPLTWNDPKNLTRGTDFPGYEDRRISEDRKLRIRNSDPAYTPNDFLKHQYPLKNQWDGSILGFNEYKSQMEGFYIQNRAWFMIDPTFQKIYCQLLTMLQTTQPYL